MKSKVNWEDFALFLIVARAGGLSGAARRSGKSAATLGRRMFALERQLGQELFIRHRSGYDLTDAAEQLLKDLSAIEARIAALGPKPAIKELPLVKISAGNWTTLFLTRNFDAIAGNPVDLRLRFVVDEDILSVTHRTISIGFRNQRPTERGLAGRKLVHNAFAAYALPDAPDAWIKVNTNTPSARWLASRAGANIICEVSSPRTALDLALAGHGRVVLPTFIGDNQPHIRRVGDPIASLAHDQWLVFHDDDRHRPETRAVIDRIYKVFRRP